MFNRLEDPFLLYFLTFCFCAFNVEMIEAQEFDNYAKGLVKNQFDNWKKRIINEGCRNESDYQNYVSLETKNALNNTFNPSARIRPENIDRDVQLLISELRMLLTASCITNDDFKKKVDGYILTKKLVSPDTINIMDFYDKIDLLNFETYNGDTFTVLEKDFLNINHAIWDTFNYYPKTDMNTNTIARKDYSLMPINDVSHVLKNLVKNLNKRDVNYILQNISYNLDNYAHLRSHNDREYTITQSGQKVANIAHTSDKHFRKALKDIIISMNCHQAFLLTKKKMFIKSLSYDILRKNTLELLTIIFDFQNRYKSLNDRNQGRFDSLKVQIYLNIEIISYELLWESLYCELKNMSSRGKYSDSIRNSLFIFSIWRSKKEGKAQYII